MSKRGIWSKQLNHSFEWAMIMNMKTCKEKPSYINNFRCEKV